MTSLEFFQAAIEIAKENGLDDMRVTTREYYNQYSLRCEIQWYDKNFNQHLVEASNNKTALKRFKKQLNK